MTRVFGLVASIGFFAAGDIIGTCKYLSRKADIEEAAATPIVQQQLVGNEQPDICIERNGVHYCSHIDGKALDDFVMECYQPRTEE